MSNFIPRYLRNNCEKAKISSGMILGFFGGGFASAFTILICVRSLAMCASYDEVIPLSNIINSASTIRDVILMISLAFIIILPIGMFRKPFKEDLLTTKDKKTVRYTSLAVLIIYATFILYSFLNSKYRFFTKIPETLSAVLAIILIFSLLLIMIDVHKQWFTYGGYYSIMLVSAIISILAISNISVLSNDYKKHDIDINFKTEKKIERLRNYTSHYIVYYEDDSYEIVPADIIKGAKSNKSDNVTLKTGE